MIEFSIRRHRRLGDRFEIVQGKYDRERLIYEIVGFQGQGHYLVARVFEPGSFGVHQTEERLGQRGTMQLGIWVGDTTTTRPYPFEATV